jgi:hypothetical protein
MLRRETDTKETIIYSVSKLPCLSLGLKFRPVLYPRVSWSVRAAALGVGSHPDGHTGRQLSKAFVSISFTAKSGETQRLSMTWRKHCPICIVADLIGSPIITYTFAFHLPGVSQSQALSISLELRLRPA